jgi:small subunit ribosomal protein S2
LVGSFPLLGREFLPNAGRLAAARPGAVRDFAGVPIQERFVSTTLVKDLIEAGVHFGHRASRWNPKMRPYIYARKNLIHIIDVRETVRGLLRAKKYLTQIASQGSLVLMVGTKRQAADSIQREAERCGMPYVNDRWLGGTLTNFRTIRSRLTRLEELEALRGDAMKYDTYSKKMQSALNREYRKMFRNLNGIRTMNRLPECLIIIDPKKEKNAVSEAQKMGVASVSLIDTDCDPDLVDLPIPGNDDSMRSIEMVVKMLADAILAGKQQAAVQSQRNAEGGDTTNGAPAK